MYGVPKLSWVLSSISYCCMIWIKSYTSKSLVSYNVCHDVSKMEHVMFFLFHGVVMSIPIHNATLLHPWCCDIVVHKGNIEISCTTSNEDGSFNKTIDNTYDYIRNNMMTYREKSVYIDEKIIYLYIFVQCTGECGPYLNPTQE